MSEHAHDHIHEHGHDHIHEHGHDHIHEHEHDHVHEHDYAHEHEHDHAHEHSHRHMHTHIDAEGHVITHTHEIREGHKEHGHYHSPEVKKKQLNRMAKALGHLQHVKLMMENDEDCAEVLIQLSAVESALHNLGKEIINEHMTHCITHAIEEGDITAVEEFQNAIKKFL